MQVNVKRHIRTEQIRRTLAERVQIADHILAVQAAKDTEPFVPARTRSLAIRTKIDGGRIVYPGPYAHYLYEGKLYVDPETGSAWARKGVTKELTDKDLVFSKRVHGQAQDHWFEASKALNMERWSRIYGRAVGRGG